MAKSNQHVVPKNGGWAVRKQGSPKATKVFPTKTEAVAFARNVAKKNSGELYVHAADGTVRDHKSYSKDTAVQ